MSEPGKYLRIAEAAKFLGVSTSTLRNWEDAGIITPVRTPTNARRYTREQLEALLTQPAK